MKKCLYLFFGLLPLCCFGDLESDVARIKEETEKILEELNDGALGEWRVNSYQAYGEILARLLTITSIEETLLTSAIFSNITAEIIAELGDIRLFLNNLVPYNYTDILYDIDNKLGNLPQPIDYTEFLKPWSQKWNFDSTRGYNFTLLDFLEDPSADFNVPPKPDEKYYRVEGENFTDYLLSHMENQAAIGSILNKSMLRVFYSLNNTNNQVISEETKRELEDASAKLEETTNNLKSLLEQYRLDNVFSRLRQTTEQTTDKINSLGCAGSQYNTVVWQDPHYGTLKIGGGNPGLESLWRDFLGAVRSFMLGLYGFLFFFLVQFIVYIAFIALRKIISYTAFIANPRNAIMSRYV